MSGETIYVPIREYPWGDDFSWLRTVTCNFHRDARYLTKNPFDRSLHFIAGPKGEGIERNELGECKCKFSDMVVVVGPGTKEEEEYSTRK